MITRSALNEEDVYTQVQLKQGLEKHFGLRVSIVTVKQLSNTVTFTSGVQFIIQGTWPSSWDEYGEYIRTEIKTLAMEHHDNRYSTSADTGSVEGNIT